MSTPRDTRPIVIFGTLRSASLARFCLTHDSPLQVAAFTLALVAAPAGELLAGVAQRLQQVVRGGDVVARLGGDEFALLMHDADVAQATDRQVSTVNEIAGHIEQIAQMSGETSTLMQRSSQAAGELEHIAVTLREQTRQFKVS